MKIPKRFKLMGRTINVRYDDLLLVDSDHQGQACYRFNEIKMQTPSNTLPLPNMQQTFCHELVHWLLYFAGGAYQSKSEYMHQDEAFVDLLGGLLHQALTTMEYEQHDNDSAAV